MAQINVKINTNDGVDNLGKINQELDDSVKTLKSLNEQSAKLRTELEGVGIGTAEYERLKNELIKVNTELKNQDLALEALDHEQVASELKSVVGGLTDMAGGLTLLGVSGGTLEEIAQKFAKVEGISRIATGAMESYQSGMKLVNNILVKSAAAQNVMTTATTAGGVASSGAAVKFRALTAAMVANPFTAIAVALTAVISALVI